MDWLENVHRMFVDCLETTYGMFIDCSWTVYGLLVGCFTVVYGLFMSCLIEAVLKLFLGYFEAVFGLFCSHLKVLSGLHTGYIPADHSFLLVIYTFCPEKNTKETITNTKGKKVDMDQGSSTKPEMWKEIWPPGPYFTYFLVYPSFKNQDRAESLSCVTVRLLSGSVCSNTSSLNFASKVTIYIYNQSILHWDLSLSYFFY